MHRNSITKKTSLPINCETFVDAVFRIERGGKLSCNIFKESAIFGKVSLFESKDYNQPFLNKKIEMENSVLKDNKRGLIWSMFVYFFRLM